jgi:ligand-binding sensor domain-containing protein
MAFDTLGNLWIADTNDGSTVAELSPTGSALSPAGGYSAGSAYGYAVAVDSDISGNLWVGGVQFANNGSVLTSSTPCGSGEATTIAIDHLGNLWSSGGSGVYKCDASGNLLSPAAGYPDNIVGTIQGVAIDGDNRPWVFGTSGDIGVLSSAGTVLSPIGGYQNDKLPASGANYFAIDGSGNLWVAGDGNFVVEFVVLASPVVAPLVTAVSNNQLGVRP